MPTTAADGGLGAALVGEKISINNFHVTVVKLLGEGGFSYVYLVREITETLNNTVHPAGGAAAGAAAAGGAATGGEPAQRSNSGSNGSRRSGSMGREGEKKEMVLKVTSILSRQQREIAEKEAKLLSRLSHPSIIKMFDACYRTVPHAVGGGFRKHEESKGKERPQHMILMEFCEGGHALDVCTKMAAAGERFDLSTLIIAFGQICNAVSYLHAQRPPIVHRDLKPANFLVKNGAYKLCDFGSAVFGAVELKTPQARAEAEEVIQKTTTQMFRAPEMVDLFMAKKLTQATDVWALGCCLYSLAFLQNCFEEGSNLAILSRKYKIPDDNPYGDGLVELIDRMLTVDSKARADMTEVILCLSAVYSGRPLPPRKERAKKEKKAKEGSGSKSEGKKQIEGAGTFRVDGQGISSESLEIDPEKAKEAKEGKKLDPNSAAARRRRAVASVPQESSTDFSSFHNRFDEAAATSGGDSGFNEDLAFSTTDNPFAAFDDKSGRTERTGEGGGSDKNFFSSFEDLDVAENADAVADAFNNQNWGKPEAAFYPEDSIEVVEDPEGALGESGRGMRRSNSKRRLRRREGDASDENDEQQGVDDPSHSERRRSRRGVRRNQSEDDKAPAPPSSQSNSGSRFPKAQSARTFDKKGANDDDA